VERSSLLLTAAIQVAWRIAAYLAAFALAARLAHAGDAATAAANRSFASAFESIQAADLRKHAAYLADDTFEGREAGSRGGRAAGVYLGQELRRHGLAGGGTAGGYYQAFGNGYRNVLGLIEGNDPKLKHQVIVVSAHYDHVGYGAANNSRGPIGYIHNGADDNGSGTAGLLEVIEALAQLEPRPKRTLLVAFWDAEEKGLLGSKHWIAEPTLSLDRVRAMVNLDMIGRLRERQVEVSGVRTAVGWAELVTRQNERLDLRLTFSWEIKANSDHHPFFARGVPYLMLHTGLHTDYHRPSDDADKLNADGMQAVSRLCFRLVSELANRPTLPSFRDSSRRETAAAQTAAEQPSPPWPARLGISWPTRRKDESGLVVSDVGAASAAARAGVQRGDRIVKLDGRDVTDDGEFQSRILAIDKTCTLTLERPGEPKPLEVEVRLDGERVRIGIAWREDDAEPGAVILTRVVPASPAARADLQVNDRIYSVDGRRFESGEAFLRLLNDAQGPTPLEVAHDGEIVSRKLDVPPLRPAAAAGPPQRAPAESPKDEMRPRKSEGK
jgi:hypothetical protein